MRCLKYLVSLFFLVFSNLSYAIYPVPVTADKGMVVTAQAIASRVGADVLKQGGNAVDAAVAVGYALAVVFPYAGNLGGGGFMLLHLANGKDTFLDFRETAPLAATKNMYLDSKGNIIPNLSYKGYLAVGVPGTVMGLNTALKKYGTMSLAQVMAPAIKLAEKGYVLSYFNACSMGKAFTDFSQQANVAAIFLKDNKQYQPGDVFVQTNLANTLKLIAQKGTDVFYKGSIADDIVKASEENHGILSKKDFSNYKVEETAPIFCSYHGVTIVSAPPPSSGGITLCEILNIVEGYPLAKMGFNSAATVHYLAEAMRYAYYDRNNKLGDPDFVHDPVNKLISKDYAASIREKIKADKITPSSQLSGDSTHEGTNTTHYSIVDKFGNAVSTTYTLNEAFGARVIAGNTGFFLNNEMDDFTSKVGQANLFGLVQGEKNAIQPGKRPLSSMTPTIITKNGKTFMVLGSPDGSVIITAVLQTILNVIDHKMNVSGAVNSPRIHFQWLPDALWYEPYSLSQDTQEKLTKMGYQLFITPHSDPNNAQICYQDNVQDRYLGDVQAILVDPANNKLYGASDRRLPAGKAIGF